MTWLRIASGGNSLFNSATARKPSSTADVSAEGGGGRDGETWGWGDGETGSSDVETGGRGDRECSTSASASPALPVSPSPHLPISPSEISAPRASSSPAGVA